MYVFRGLAALLAILVAWGFPAPLVSDRLPSAATAPVAPTVTLLRWPYLQNAGATGVTIAWVTDTAAAGEVRYSTDRGYGQVATATTRSVNGQYFASAVLTGLQPGTRYYYRIRSGGIDLTPLDPAAFTTATTGNAFTFVVLGDSRDGSPAAAAIANQMAAWPFDLWLHTGDLVTSGLAAEYDPQVFAIYRRLLAAVPFFSAIGNHEYLGDGPAAYLNNFYLPQNGPAGLLGRAYSFDWANAHFTVFDSGAGFTPGSAQYNWLQSDLAATRQPWKFVVDHHPPYSSGSHGSDFAVRDTLGPLFERYGVDVMFSGHDHDYERTFPMAGGQIAGAGQRGVTYVVTGGGGAPLYPVGRSAFTALSVSTNHFTRSVVAGCQLVMQSIGANGQILDLFEIDKCAAATTLPRHLFLPAVRR